jgi:DNA-directed RNA polymerase specialized sigma24 family protein
LLQSNDAALVKSCLDGNKAAWDTLVKQHIHPVMAMARRYGLTTQDAEDVAQDTFNRVFRHLAQKNESSPLGAWIGRIAKNLCLEHVTARNMLVPLDDDLPSKNGDMQRSVEIREVFERIARRLVGNERKVWDVMMQMVTRDDWTLARMTGLPVATCHTTRMRVEGKAKEELDRQKLKPIQEH